MTSFFSFDKAHRDDQYLCRKTASGEQTSQNTPNHKSWLNVKNTGKNIYKSSGGCSDISSVAPHFPFLLYRTGSQDSISDKTVKPAQKRGDHYDGGELLANLRHCWKCCLVPWLWMQLWKCYLRKITQPDVFGDSPVQHETQTTKWLLFLLGELPPSEWSQSTEKSFIAHENPNPLLLSSCSAFLVPNTGRVFWSQTEWRS